MTSARTEAERRDRGATGGLWLAAALGWLLAGCGGSEHRPTADAGADGDADSNGDGDVDADGDADGDSDADAFFDPDNLVEIELTIPPGSWAGLEQDPFAYQPGTLRVGDVVLDDVGIRLKGAASFRDLGGKAAFKVKMDEIVPGQRLFGLRRLTLNNLAQDPSGVHERLGYAFFRAAGVPASRCNSARVSVNGEYWGLYANVESLDDEFVEARYDPAPGNLFDITTYFVDLETGSEDGYELETNRTDPDTSDLTALIDAVNGPDGSFVADAEQRLDLDEVLALGAVQAIIADWDGYFGAKNNYKLYDDLGSGRFVMFPWGIDQTFGATDSAPEPHGASYDIYGSDSDRWNGWLFVRCKAVPDCLARYQTAVADALDVWRALPLEADLDRMVIQIRSSMEEDPRRESDMEAFDAEVERVRGFLRDRAAGVQAQLDGPLPELCDNGIDDDGDGVADCDDRGCIREWGMACWGENFACIADPEPVVVPDVVVLGGGIYTGDVSGPVPDARIEVLAQSDGSVLATATTDEEGLWNVELATGGVPLEVIVRASADDRLASSRHLPPLTSDRWHDDLLFLPEDLDGLATEAGIVRDPAAGVVFLRAMDCAWVDLTFDDFAVVPTPDPLDVIGYLDIPLVLNVPPGDYEATATVSGHELGPVPFPAVAGEVTEPFPAP